jgi:pimeloyl-ACP methyl ester carboxylesterase
MTASSLLGSLLVASLLAGPALAQQGPPRKAPSAVSAAEVALYAQDRAARTAFDQAGFERTFRHETATVNGGTRIHYVIGGSGPPIVLLHGFPQTWREWRLIMPALAKAGYTVVAPDLRGFGDSDKPLDGYDARTVAEDIAQVVAGLGFAQVDVAGHDVGGMVAYAFAKAHPQRVRRLAIMEGLPPGFDPPGAGGSPTFRGQPIWHSGFNMTPDLPELLTAGRERAFLNYFYTHFAEDPTAISAEDLDAYTRTYAAAGGMRGAFEHYRALGETARQNREGAGVKLAIPVLAIGAETSYGEGMGATARLFATDVRALVVGRTGHWIAEERPVWLTRELLAFFGEGRGRAQR